MDDEFDPAAFGLPAGFGQKAKPKAAKPSFDKTKRAEKGKAAATSIEAAPREASEAASLSIDDAEQQEPGPSGTSRSANGGQDPREEEENDEDEDDGQPDLADDDEYWPISHEIIMKDHTKAVTALSIDPPGARIVTGGYDYDVKLWDFGGMQADFRPFKSFEPYENYHVHDVQWNANGSQFLVIAGTLQAKLYGREGAQIAEYQKGDMYIRDLKNTAGHTGQLSSCSWDPRDGNKFLTSSFDSTVRIWDANERFKSVKTIVVKSKERGARTKITSATYSHDGRTIAAAGIDGTLHLWSTSSNFARPNHTIENAHLKGTETSGLTFSLDNHTLVSRGGDDTVKTWDTRAFKKPLSVAESLSSLNPETNVIFSPDEKYILTGTAGSKAGIVPGKNDDAQGKPGGKIVVMDRQDLKKVKEIDVSQGSVIRIAWPSRINQILASTSLGEVHVLYSPTISEKGATLAASRAPRARHNFDEIDIADRPILTPHALPMFKDAHYDISDAGTAQKRKRETLTKAAIKSRKPEAPIKGAGHGGRVGEAADRHIIMGMVKDDLRSEDPREALLRYATKEGEETKWTKAWGKDQKTLYDTRPDPEEEPPKK